MRQKTGTSSFSSSRVGSLPMLTVLSPPLPAQLSWSPGREGNEANGWLRHYPASIQRGGYCRKTED